METNIVHVVSQNVVTKLKLENGNSLKVKEVETEMKSKTTGGSVTITFKKYCKE